MLGLLQTSFFECCCRCRFACTPEGYESLSEIRLSAKKRNALSLLLADTRLREDGDEDLNSSFITRVQDISGQLASNMCVETLEVPLCSDGWREVASSCTGLMRAYTCCGIQLIADRPGAWD